MDTKTFIDSIIKAEGGYVDHPSDRGGPTMYGITQAVARANGYAGAMRDMPEALARSIYERRYIVEPGFQRVAELSEPIAHEMIDTGVNMGVSVPGPWLQRWLNVFNARGSKYADVFVDGRIGPVTLDALQSFLRWRGAEGAQVMVVALNVLQGGRYLEIAEKTQTQEDFIYGWVRNRVMLTGRVS